MFECLNCFLLFFLKNEKLLEVKRAHIEQRKQETENEFDAECTFKPKLNGFKFTNLPSFEERNRAWLANREQQIELKRKLDENRDLEGCTFHPEIVYFKP